MSALFSLLPLVILILVAYLIIRKSKKTLVVNDGEYPAWFDKLPEPAQQIRLKEWHKKTEKIFTVKWFLEYWQGQRSAFHAWFNWILIPGIALFLLERFLAPFHVKAHILLFIEIPFIPLRIIGAIILWKCADHSIKKFKIVAKVFAAILLIINVFLLVVYGYAFCAHLFGIKTALLPS